MKAPGLSLLLSILLLHCSRAGSHTFEADALPGWLGEISRNATQNNTSFTTAAAVAAKQEEEPHVTALSWRPRAFVYQNFLTDEECMHLISLATPSLAKSTVVDPISGRVVQNSYRSSWGAFITRGQDAVVSRVEEKISRWAFLPVENQEDMQVLRYKPGQKYDPHTDFFEEKDKEYMAGGHRIATVILYLTDVAKGGETVFNESPSPNLSLRTDRSWSQCGKQGVGVKPVKGSALLFYSLHPNATTDGKSVHTGCKVLQGEKWTATKWIHVKAFTPPAPQAPEDPTCKDIDPLCRAWAKAGECKSNAGFMLSQCRRSCNNCKGALDISIK